MAKPSVSALEAHLGYWLRMVSNHVSGAFQRKLESKGVTAAEWVIMRDLFGREAANPSEIAAALGMTRGAISKLIDRLADKGLAVRAASKKDRRYQSVALTAPARALVPSLAALADRNDEEVFSVLSDSERRTLMKLMKKLARLHGLKEAPTA